MRQQAAAAKPKPKAPPLAKRKPKPKPQPQAQHRPPRLPTPHPLAAKTSAKAVKEPKAVVDGEEEDELESLCGELQSLSSSLAAQKEGGKGEGGGGG